MKTMTDEIILIEKINNLFFSMIKKYDMKQEIEIPTIEVPNNPFLTTIYKLNTILVLR